MANKDDLDNELESLFDEKEINKHRRNAEEHYKDFTSDDIEYFRKRCKSDLFFLANGPLEYTLLSPRLHGNVAKWYERTRGSQYRLMLLPRDHFKSTLGTVVDSVQMALPNTAGIQEHPYSLGPNVKTLIAHEVAKTATKFLFEISAAFTRKELLMALFPECIPTKNYHRINQYELELPRTEHHKEATFSTIGAGGSAQGGHYHWLKLDDIIGQDARESETVMRRTVDWFDNVNSLLTRPKLDGWDLIGTRWAYSDVYSHAMEIYGIDLRDSILNCVPEKDIDKHGGGLLKVYARGMIEDGKLIFPEENTMEYANVLRKNRKVWSAQYANNPLESGLNEFPWPLKYYNITSHRELVVFTGESSEKISLQELDICVFCDPSMGESEVADDSGIIVTGIDKKNRIFILETVKKRLRPPELIDTLFKLNRKYRPRIIAIEEVNFSAVYRYWLEEKSREARVYLPIRSYKPGTKRSKEARIRGLAHFFAAGQVYVFENMHDLRDEYEQFPLGTSQHLLDALSQGPSYWQKGNSKKEVESLEARFAKMEAERSVLTGY